MMPSQKVSVMGPSNLAKVGIASLKDIGEAKNKPFVLAHPVSMDWTVGQPLLCIDTLVSPN